jgi:hypothetical protein
MGYRCHIESANAVENFPGGKCEAWPAPAIDEGPSDGQTES